MRYRRRVRFEDAGNIMGRGANIRPGLTAGDFGPIPPGVTGLSVGDPAPKVPGVTGATQAALVATHNPTSLRRVRPNSTPRRGGGRARLTAGTSPSPHRLTAAKFLPSGRQIPFSPSSGSSPFPRPPFAACSPEIWSQKTILGVPRLGRPPQVLLR
jgi:hypothetical protein